MLGVFQDMFGALILPNHLGTRFAERCPKGREAVEGYSQPYVDLHIFARQLKVELEENSRQLKEAGGGSMIDLRDADVADAQSPFA